MEINGMTLLKTPYIEKKPSSLRYYQEGVPNIDVDAWTLNITSLTGNSVKLDRSALLALPQFTHHRRMVCVCNWSIKRYWQGVLLEDVLAEARIDTQATANTFLKQTSVGTTDKGVYESWIRLDEALERSTILAHSVDGEPLPLEQGYPLRLIDFGLYGYKNVKGLTSIEVVDQWQLGHWERIAGYALDGTVKPKRYWAVDLKSHQFTQNKGEVTDW